MELTRTEFLLLELLLRNARQVLPRELIFDRVWGYDFGANSNSLEVYIGYLRRKTEAGGEPRLIHTVRGVGYVLRQPAGGLTCHDGLAATKEASGCGWALWSRPRWALTVALAALASYFSVHHQLYSQVDSSLNGELAVLAHPRGSFAPTWPSVLQRHYNNSLLQVIDPSGNVDSVLPPSSPALPVSAPRPALATAGVGTQYPHHQPTRGRRYRLLTVGARSSRHRATPRPSRSPSRSPTSSTA